MKLKIKKLIINTPIHDLATLFLQKKLPEKITFHNSTHYTG